MKTILSNYLAAVLLILILSGCGTATQTSDLFTSSQSARATSDAWAQQAQFQERFLTATAEAPIIHITETAAGLIVVGTQAAMQKTLIAEAWTPTPSPIPTITFSPTPNIAMTSTLAHVHAQGTQIALDTERAQITNTALAILPYAVILVAFLLVVPYAYTQIKKSSFVPHSMDERGKVIPMINVVDGVAFDIDRATNGMIATTQNFLKQLPGITAERQDQVTARAQLVDMQTRRARLPQRLLQSQSVENNLLPAGPSQLFPLPNWSDLNEWKFDKDLIPLGKSDQGLEYWDVRNYPHLSVFGMTRSGKSRRSLRPLIAMLLASGQRVVLVGKESDFVPFQGHPNVVFVPVYEITERAEAMKYFQVLSAAVREKSRRLRVMAANGQSLWQGERTFLIFDELGNAIVEMDNDIGDDTLRKARSIVNEAGKTGMSLLFSAQRPKGFIDLTTQCGRVVFQVETDQEKGYALGYKGADKLPEVPVGYFYRKFSSVKVLGAFEPSDDEIRAVISRPVGKVSDDDGWIEGMLVEQASLPVQKSQPELPPSKSDEPTTLDQFLGSLTDQDAQIIDLHIEGKSNRQIELAVFGKTGGQFYTRVSGLVRQYKAYTPTATTIAPNMPNLSAVAA